MINVRLKIRTTLVRTTIMSHDYDDAQLTWNKVDPEMGYKGFIGAKNCKIYNLSQKKS